MFLVFHEIETGDIDSLYHVGNLCAGKILCTTITHLTI